MIINWYGEGCFKIQTGGLTILTDTFESKIGLTPPRGKFDFELKTLIPWPLASQKNNEEGEIIYGAGEYEIKGITVRGFPLLNESSEKFLKTIYKVTAEDITLGFFGHISEELNADAFEIFADTDIIFLPAGEKPFLNSENAAKLIKQIKPKIVVASFFSSGGGSASGGKTPGLKRATADYKALSNEIGQKPEIMEKLTIKKKELAEQKTMKFIALKI